MGQGNQGGARCAWAQGMIVGAALAVALSAVASSPSAAMSKAAVVGEDSAESNARIAGMRGLPDKPAGLDDASWTSLKQAIGKSVQQAKLVAGDAAAFDNFGWSVALAGDTALVGAIGDDVGPNLGQGSAYVFTRSGTTWTQQAKLVADDGAASDQFGRSVALAGDTALVGAFTDSVGANSGQGSAYVFTRSGTTWTQQAKLVAGDGAAFDQFGSSVALAGDTALVGANFDDVGANGNQGSAYVFTRSGTTWTQQAKLVADDGAASDQFGESVALSGDTALVGAFTDRVGGNNSQGSAYVFTRSGTTWTQQAKLVAGDGAANDQFGLSVALSGNTALVGAARDDTGANVDQGSAYVYTRSSTTWTQQTKLVAGNGAAGDLFGWSVALAGDSALVGAISDDVGASADEGSAYVFARSGTTWTQQATLVAGDGAAADAFGFSVALAGDTALVGASFASVGAGVNQGAAYVFTGVQPATDLEVSKTDGTPWAIPDSTVLYEIRVANAGPLAVQGARLRDLLPAGLVDGLWTCAPVQLATCPQAAGTGNIDQLLDLPVNGILRYQLSARVTAPLGSMLTNTATVEVPATVIELEPADNSASDTNSVVPEGIFWNGFEPLPPAISVPSGGR